MRFCKLRIAWSATCLIACVLLIVLWVRSGVHFDGAIWCSATDSVSVPSALWLFLGVEQPVNRPQSAFPNWVWHVGSKPLTDPVNVERDIMNYHKTLGF